MKLAIGIPTLGRPDLLKKVVDRFALQSRIPDGIFISPASDKDAAGIDFDGKSIVKIKSERGASKQRNAIINSLQDYDIAVFCDDDFVLHKDCLKKIELEFIQNPSTVIAHGVTVADGANGPGLSYEEVCTFADNAATPEDSRIPSFSTYGFIAVRLSTVREHGIYFEERFPLYSWLEDLDFSRRIVGYGDCIKLPAAMGAHMGHKAGRTSGVKFGYSQVANPLHIAAKRIGFSYGSACKMLTKNFLANLLKSFMPEPYIDRKGRLKGNLIAFKDLLLGKLDPENIESL